MSTLRDLEYIVAVADHTSFGKAAEACNVSQPSLSIQIRKLEETLGVQLFERTSKSVMLTPAGEQIIAQARIVLREADTLKQLAREAKDPLGGTLRLGVFPTLAPYWFPKAVPLLKASFPALALQLIEEKTDTLLTMLENGTLDAIVLALPVEGHPRLEHAVLFHEPFLAALPARHPLATRNTITPADIASETLLLLEEGHCLRGQALDFCTMAGAHEQAGYRATSLETLRNMVAAGEGMTIIPQSATRQDNTAIHYIPFSTPAPGRTIALFWRKTSARHPLFKQMVSLLATPEAQP